MLIFIVELWFYEFLTLFCVYIFNQKQKRKYLQMSQNERKPINNHPKNDVDSILKFPLLYGGVSIPHGCGNNYMFWGASIEVAKNEKV